MHPQSAPQGLLEVWRISPPSRLPCTQCTFCWSDVHVLTELCVCRKQTRTPWTFSRSSGRYGGRSAPPDSICYEFLDSRSCCFGSDQTPAIAPVCALTAMFWQPHPWPVSAVCQGWHCGRLRPGEDLRAAGRQWWVSCSASCAFHVP